jgi:transposase
MPKYATENIHHRVLVWIVWLLVVVVCLLPPTSQVDPGMTRPVLGVVVHDASRSGPLFPWQSRYRWKKWALRQYHTWRAAYRRARRRALLARWALAGMVTLAQVVDWLTASQLRYQLGALPVLYALLETLEIRSIINRHCASRAEVDHGTVALVLILNRLMLPLPLYQISDWVGQTVLGAVLGIPAAKFNDDRLGRTLDALSPHLDVIWPEIRDTALVKAQVDLSVLFYDVSAFVAHGRYADSALVDFGFAHNTPSNKRKLKMGLNVSADGNIPLCYQTWSGHTADQATVQSNLENLAAWLHRHRSPPMRPLIVGDRAMLSAEIALAYERQGLRHLTGLRAATSEHKALLVAWSDAQMEDYPLVAGPDPQYWGRGCRVSFTHAGRTVIHRGLVVVSGPLREQWRQSRQARLDALGAELEQLRRRIGQPRLRTVPSVQRSVNARLRASHVADLVQTTVYATPSGQVNLLWQLDEAALAQAERLDGRYLLVTNDWSLSHREMFRLYREKDGVETCFHICKDDLAVSPLYLHQDQRIAAMLFLNLVALLAYTLLQRQIQKQGLPMTTRRLMERLHQLTLIETHCWDGSCLRRLTPADPELSPILHLVSQALAQMVHTVVASDSPALLGEPVPVVPLALLC